MSEGIETLYRDPTSTTKNTENQYTPFVQWARLTEDTEKRVRREQHPVFEYTIHLLDDSVQDFSRHLFTQMHPIGEGRDLLEELLLHAETRKEMQMYVTDRYVAQQMNRIQRIYGAVASILPPY